jgi:hypothetical protein
MASAAVFTLFTGLCLSSVLTQERWAQSRHMINRLLPLALGSGRVMGGGKTGE